jgi:TolB-like protein/DNA-binding winged helix-turn-helix (wHTH) protein
VAVSVFEFGEFKLDCDRFELYRDGRGLKLERKPMELLILLVARNGHLVTRTEIAERLWDRAVFVDTEHGINTAIRKIRQALRDDPEQPRFVQTVPGKGYRFVCENNDEKSETNGDLPSAVPVPTGPAAEVAAVAAPATAAAAAAKMYRSPAAAAVLLITIALAGTVVAFNVGVVRDRIFSGGRARQIHSVAVIPLANLSGDASQDYFADGMTDELITALAKNRSLRVVSRTSAMQYKGVHRPVRDIARELGVDGILEGSIERTGNRVHMTVQLIYAPTDSHVWAESYDRDLNQAFSLPEELSQTVAKEVKTATSPTTSQRYINPEAHDAYLRGRYFWFSGNIAETLSYFEKAIQLQPDYAAAWSGLADTYSMAGMGYRPPLEVMPKALEAARKAQELDDSASEVHTSMAAWNLFYGWDLPHADSEARRAIELNPNYAEGHQVRVETLLAMNREPEALAEQKRAVELDAYVRPSILGVFYIGVRQYDAAINELRLQHTARPQDESVLMALSKAYWLKGMYKESQETLEEGLRIENNQEALTTMHKAWILGGEKAVEQRGVENIKVQARKGYVYPYSLASTFAFAGDKEQTLKCLEEAYRQHAPDLITVQYDPIFDFVHDDPRYRAILKQMGLLPADSGSK